MIPDEHKDFWHPWISFAALVVAFIIIGKLKK